MKEIIYLNTDLMNSMLAQLEEGLITGFSQEENLQETETQGQQSQRGSNAGLNGQLQMGSGAIPGLNLRLGANIGNTGNEISHDSKSILEGQKDILNKAFHDYALDILINKLEESEKLKENSNLSEGDIFTFKSRYKFYDFDLIQNILDVDRIERIIKHDISEDDYKEAKRILKKSKPTSSERERLEWAREVVLKTEAAENSVKGIKTMELVSGYFSKALRDVSILKADQVIAILKKNYLRELPEALSLRPDQSRNITILARTIGKKEKVSQGPELGAIFNPEDLDTVPGMIFDIMLGSFSILKKDDILVTPIAIYYE